jgi:hypothetical protein
VDLLPAEVKPRWMHGGSPLGDDAGNGLEMGGGGLDRGHGGAAFASDRSGRPDLGHAGCSCCTLLGPGGDVWLCCGLLVVRMSLPTTMEVLYLLRSRWVQDSNMGPCLSALLNKGGVSWISIT